MSQPDLTHLPVHELSRQLAARRLSPVDLVDAFLARIARRTRSCMPSSRCTPTMRGWPRAAPTRRFAPDIGRTAARRPDRAQGPDRDRRQGRDRRLRGLDSRKAARTATLASRLMAQGMIVLGKTHTVEFAMGGWGTNTRRGTPWNPWDPKRPRTPGGSSSGSGVAVAAGLAPWAVGTDTGGSVRLPASWCGITGLKTTIGRVSTYGVLPLSPTLDTPGPMARSVEDAALLYTAMQGADPLDPLTRGLPFTDPMATLRRGVRGIRLARMPQGERQHASADVLAAYDRSLAELERLEQYERNQ